MLDLALRKLRVTNRADAEFVDAGGAGYFEGQTTASNKRSSTLCKETKVQSELSEDRAMRCSTMPWPKAHPREQELRLKVIKASLGGWTDGRTQLRC